MPATASPEAIYAVVVTEVAIPTRSSSSLRNRRFVRLA
jgi:hypothetical protein